MRVCIISAAFPPEPVVSAKTSSQIASALTQAGHTVSVIAPFPNRPSGKIYQGYSRSLLRFEKSPDGYQIWRCFSFLSARSTILSRFLENISFGVVGGIISLIIKKPDVIYLNTWPIFSSGIFSLISRLLRVPLLISIQDLYPESLATQDRIRPNGLLFRLLLWIDGKIARNANGIIVISNGFADVYRKTRKVNTTKIHVVPNWADADEIRLDVNVEGYRAQKDIPRNAFVVLYGGNIGVASGIDTLLASFKKIGSNANVYLVIAGEGSQLAYCQKVASSIPRNHIIIHSPWHEHETSLILRSADLLLLSTKNEQSLSSIPSKLIYYLLAGRPILARVHPDSETAKVITRANCGWMVHSDQPDQIVEKILWIKDNCYQDLEKYGQSGRMYAIKHYSKESCLPRITELIYEIGTSKSR